MNNFERVRDLVDEYVQANGTDIEMSRGEFLDWVHQTYESISSKTNNLYPTDICYNLYNAGLKDFPGPNLCLLYVPTHNSFRLVGSNYKHNGNIWQYKDKSNERIVGRWINGECQMMPFEGISMSDSILLRRNDIEDGIKRSLKNVPVTVEANDKIVSVNFQEILICGVVVEEEVYKLFNASVEWNDKTTYLGDEEENGTWSYYIENADAVISEVHRLVLFEAKKSSSSKQTDTSHLRQTVSKEAFEIAYKNFLEQADRNTQSRSTTGSKKVPLGVEHIPNHKIDGWDFTTHYGFGNPSRTPYLNWHVVSIYYMTDTGQIIIGIEAERYKMHTGKNISEMNPIRMKKFSNKKTDVAIFYQTSRDRIDYSELYEKFVGVSEEYVRLNGYN